MKIPIKIEKLLRTSVCSCKRKGQIS